MDSTRTRSRSGDTSSFFGVTYGDEYFVAVGQTYDATAQTNKALIKTSTDGTNWISRIVDSASPVYGVAFGQNTFLAVGDGIILQSDYLLTEPTILTRETHISDDRRITLAIQSSLGDTIAVESSDDLGQWAALTTVTNSAGVVAVTDGDAQNLSRRFYRAKLVTP